MLVEALLWILMGKLCITLSGAGVEHFRTKIDEVISLCRTMRRKAQSFTFFLALLISLGVTVFETTDPAKAEPECKNGGVYVLFARGSGETFNGPRALSFQHYIMQAIANAGIENQWAELGNLDNKPGPDNKANNPGEYPAVAWTNWGILTGWEGYYASVRTGVAELARHLNDRAAKCPKESIVIGGYSQGAEVVGTALFNVSSYTLSRIAYVALYGDPRTSACNAIMRPPWSRGNAFCALGSLGARAPYIPMQLTGRVGSWCDAWDGVCTGFAPLTPPNPLSSHTRAYQDRWIADSANEIANKALSKRNELNPSSQSAPLPSYTITPPDTSADSPAAPPPPPVVNSVKRTAAPNGTREVYAATKSSVTEAWWSPGGDGAHESEIIHISQDNIVGFDKVNEPNGITQSLYTAVPDGVWETWWRPNEGVHHNKIITGLSGVRQVIADPVTDSVGYTHRLYVLASDGPYEVWWRDGGDGIHANRLDVVNGPVTMDKSRGSDGTDQLYVATPTYVYELWWRPGTGVHHGTVINITQGNIRSLDKGDNLSDGGQLLYTGTSTTAWQTYWNSTTGVGLTNGIIATGQTNAIQIKKTVYNGVHELYLATPDHVQEYWWNGPNNGTSTLINISQNNITGFDKSSDGADQQIYTASGDLVYETWWRAGVGPTSSVLFKVAR
ncbi:cutinase family protein [Frankia sp. Cj5]|uniref:cutinase family protein n=1 Tax=Frankia sp. Cj5 TaxID=2880978 RepID=UPI001EF3F5D6|nr:cutinase family protein [Frankia sp. Cj5]